MSEKELYRRINRIFLFAYFFLLILVQIIGIYCIISYYHLMGLEILMSIIIFITILWPIVLSIVLRKFFARLARVARVKEKKLYKEIELEE